MTSATSTEDWFATSTPLSFFSSHSVLNPTLSECVYRRAVLPPCAKQDMMLVTGGTRRVFPFRDVGAPADDYSLTADWDNQ